MSGKTTIEWTDATWNPVRGCTKVSPGCKNCYAEAFAERWRGIPGHPYERGFDLRLAPDQLVAPLRWVNGRMVFVNSMSDLFHADLPFAYLELVAEVIRMASWHGFQVLTKRADELERLTTEGGLDLMAPNTIVGVTVEDRRYGVPRIGHLRRAKVAARMLSIEPLLEDLGELDLTGIDWVIVGGESGHGARPMHPTWVEAIRAQCGDQGIPFFFKQWGGVNKKKAGRLLDGRTHDDTPRMRMGKRPDRKHRRRLIEYIETKTKAWRPDLQDRAMHGCGVT